MTDFALQHHVLRGDMAEALADNPEQTMWVLGEIAGLMSTDELVEHLEMAEDQEVIVLFLEELEEKIRADMEGRD